MAQFLLNGLKMDEPFLLQKQGARWFHTDDYHSPNLSKASMGLFFHEVLKTGAHIGSIYVMRPDYNRSTVLASVFMTEEMKDQIEANTKFRFRDPPKVHLNNEWNN